jgi:alkylhydroperoxidase family enzyme
MSTLAPLDPARLTGKAKALVDYVVEQRGRAPNLVRQMAHSPAVLGGYLGFTRAMSEAAAPRELLALVAVTVAATVGDDYAKAIAGQIAAGAGVSPAAIGRAGEAAAEDPRTDAALKFARDLVAAGGRLPVARVDELKALGLGEGEIAEIVGTVCLNLFRAYFSLVARPEVDFAPAVIAQVR